MTKQKKPEKNIKPPPKPKKAKGPVTLGRTTFIDEIYKKTESQPSVGPRRIISKQPTSSLQATGSPSVAFAEVHSQTEEQDFQEIENSTPELLQEGNFNNLCEGEGETRETEEPRHPIETNQPLNSPDKGSAAKVIVEGTQSPRTSGILIIPDKGSVIKTIPVKAILSQPRNTLLDIPEGYCHIFDPMAQNQPNTQTSTLQYPIVDSTANTPMKAIPLQHIPTFHSLTSEDPDAFLFEFDVLCRGYDYTTDPQKLKLFPSTLKGTSLRWFMGLGGGVINNWDQMKESFLKKYQDYCRTRELKDEIFQMTAKPNETLEEYVERF